MHNTARSDRLPFILCEAPGGYEQQVLQGCVELGPPAHRAHSTHNFVKYIGLSTKTDTVDAGMLAFLAPKSDALRLWQPPSKETVELRSLRRRRDDLA